MVTQSMLMKRAAKLRGPSCESCGATENLHAHHMDGDRTNNSLENLRTLCGGCHTRWHWENGKRAWRRHSATCLACGKPANRLGLCETHRSRYLRHGHPCLTKKKVGSSWRLVMDRGSLSGLEFRELLTVYPIVSISLEDSAMPSSPKSPSGSDGD